MNRSSFTCAAALMAMLCVGACAGKAKYATPGTSASVEAPPQGSQLVPEAVQRSGLGPGSQADLQASAGDRVFFAVDSHTLSAEARETLDGQAAWLARHPDLRVVVAGNADERGTREYNLALGSRRATAARDYLVSRGVASPRLRTVSYGKERPVDPRSGEEAWARNRNANTVLVDVVASW